MLKRPDETVRIIKECIDKKGKLDVNKAHVKLIDRFEISIFSAKTIMGWKLHESLEPGTVAAARLAECEKTLEAERAKCAAEGCTFNEDFAYVKDGKVTVPVHDFVKNGTKLADVTITGVTYDVTVTNAQTEFVLWYKNPTTANATKVDGNTVTLTVKVGDTIALGFHRDTVKAGIVATVAMTGTDDQQVTWNANGDVWTTAFVPETNAVTVDSITAKFTFTMGERTSDVAKALNFTTGEGVSSMSDNDAIEWTAVPGSTKTVYVEYSDHNAAGVEVSNGVDKTTLRLATANTASNINGSAFIFSSNTIAQSGDYNVFVVTFVPVANSDSITGFTWNNELFA